MSSNTVYKYLQLPTISGDSGVWGSEFNVNTFPTVDSALGGYTAITLSSANVVLSTAQDATLILRLTGTPSTNLAVTSNNQGIKIIENLTVGNNTITVNTGIGTPLPLSPNSATVIIFDTTNGPRNGITLSSLSNTSLTIGSYGSTLLSASTWESARSSLFPAQSVTASSSSLNIDMSLGWDVKLTLSATVTSFTLSNIPSTGVSSKLILDITNTGSYNISAWPTGTIWPGGNIPTITQEQVEKILSFSLQLLVVLSGVDLLLHRICFDLKGEKMTTYVTVIFNYSGTQTFTIPNDMNWNNFTVECIGGGGMGGGAYAATTNGTFSFPNGYGPGATIPLTVGYPSGGSVIDSWFGSTAYGSAMCAAESGFFGDGASGGRAAYSIGNVKYSGGNGGLMVLVVQVVVEVVVLLDHMVLVEWWQSFKLLWRRWGRW